jgi:hypothetical protein
MPSSRRSGILLATRVDLFPPPAWTCFTRLLPTMAVCFLQLAQQIGIERPLKTTDATNV